MKNGKSENVWPSSNGTKSAHVVAFPQEDQDLQDDFQATFDIRHLESYVTSTPGIEGQVASIT